MVAKVLGRSTTPGSKGKKGRTETGNQAGHRKIGSKQAGRTLNWPEKSFPDQIGPTEQSKKGKQRCCGDQKQLFRPPAYGAAVNRKLHDYSL